MYYTSLTHSHTISSALCNGISMGSELPMRILSVELLPPSPRENEKVKAIGEKTSTAFKKTGTVIKERASTLRVSHAPLESTTPLSHAPLDLDDYKPVM